MRVFCGSDDGGDRINGRDDAYKRVVGGYRLCCALRVASRRLDTPAKVCGAIKLARSLAVAKNVCLFFFFFG